MNSAATTVEANTLTVPLWKSSLVKNTKREIEASTMNGELYAYTCLIGNEVLPRTIAAVNVVKIEKTT